MKKELLTLMLLCEVSFANPEQNSDKLDCQFSTDKGYMITPKDRKWVEADQIFYPGAKVVRLFGNSQCPGSYTTIVKLPKNFEIKPHLHSTYEQFMVLSGIFHFAMGDKIDKAKGMPLKEGSYMYCPPGTHHYFWTEEETVLMIQGEGPWGISYINPMDDPRNKKPS